MNGTGVSPGISIGRARLIKKKQWVLTGIHLEDEAAIIGEQEKFKQAVRESTAAVEMLIKHAGPGETADILETQVELLNDPQMERDVFARIKNDKKNAQDAVMEVTDSLVQFFRQLPDPYLSARAADLQDIGNRILTLLNGSDNTELKLPVANSIIVAEDLTASDTLMLDIRNIAGFVTAAGGKTSHTAIIAKLRGIPAVAGCGSALDEIQENDCIILDGETGLVFVNPDAEKIISYERKRTDFQSRTAVLKKLKGVPAVTEDGKKITLLANIGAAADLESVHDQGGEGVGLLRTELLFLGRDSFPTEEEQFAFYRDVALKSKGKPVTVRTLDIGGDKQLPYFGIPAEQNPFLGYRAIRICLDRKDIFETQLRAILRASALGKFRIMFPMISNIQEIRLAKGILTAVKIELRKAGISFDENIRTGIMIEVPSAAVTADLLAKEVDFFSIGTNDLCQYTLAADRMNEKIKDLYEPFNPAVLRLIRFVIEQGEKNKIPVGMCGELASDPIATLLLLGMGLTEFSMNAGSIPNIKDIIVHSSMKKARTICEAVMGMDESGTIINYLEAQEK